VTYRISTSVTWTSCCICRLEYRRFLEVDRLLQLHSVYVFVHSARQRSHSRLHPISVLCRTARSVCADDWSHARRSSVLSELQKPVNRRNEVSWSTCRHVARIICFTGSWNFRGCASFPEFFFEFSFLKITFVCIIGGNCRDSFINITQWFDNFYSASA